MNPRFFVIVFTIFILAVIGYVGFTTLQEKLGLNEPKCQVYFLKGETLKAVSTALLSGQNALKESLALLQAGPTDKQIAQGYYSVLPKELRIFGYEQRGNTLYLKINDGLQKMSGGTSQILAAVAQLVYTATAQPGIKNVVFQVNGQLGTLVLGGEGYVIDKPLGRDDIRF